jgi:hypothetical protein
VRGSTTPSAILLNQVFSWVQQGRSWSPESHCEDDAAFVELLGVMSALVPGAGATPTHSTVIAGACRVMPQ